MKSKEYINIVSEIKKKAKNRNDMLLKLAKEGGIKLVKSYLMGAANINTMDLKAPSSTPMWKMGGFVKQAKSEIFNVGDILKQANYLVKGPVILASDIGTRAVIGTIKIGSEVLEVAIEAGSSITTQTYVVLNKAGAIVGKVVINSTSIVVDGIKSGTSLAVLLSKQTSSYVTSSLKQVSSKVISK